MTYVEADLFSHLAPSADGGFRTYGGRFAYGARRGLEVGGNVFYTRADDTGQPVEVQPNAKWQFYRNEERGVQAAAGAILYLPVTHRAGTDTFGMMYTTVSKKVRASYGPRLTAGAYALAGRVRGAGARAGGMLAYEQPLSRRVTLVADWYSGRNRFGYAGGGLAFATTNRGLLQVGYNVGNEGRRNNYLSVLYGHTF